jgi:hypothetical protein
VSILSRAFAFGQPTTGAKADEARQVLYDQRDALLEQIAAAKAGQRPLEANAEARAKLTEGMAAQAETAEDLAAAYDAEAQALVDGATDVDVALDGMGGSAGEADDRVTDLSEALDLAASGGLKRIGKEAVNADRRWRNLMSHPDRNRQSLRELSGEIGKWNRRFTAAVKDNDTQAAAFALSQIGRLERERDKRRAVVDMVREERKQLGLIPAKTDADVNVNITGQGALDRVQSDLVAVEGTYTARVNVRTPRGQGSERFLASGGRADAGRPYWVGEFSKELFVPDRDGRVMTGHQVDRSGGSGPQVSAQIFGLPMQARTAVDVIEELRRAVRLGVLEPDRQTGWASAP